MLTPKTTCKTPNFQAEAHVCGRVYGMILVVLGAVCQFSVATVSMPIESGGWAFFRIMGTASISIAVGCTVALLVSEGRDGLQCSRHQAKWLFARTLCNNASFFLAILAEFAGTCVGDIWALRSVNVAVAAIVGIHLRDERVGPCVHFATLLSIAGAVMISEPWASRDAEDSTCMPGSTCMPAWVGYVLSLLSGTFHGLTLICTRRCASIPSLPMTASTLYVQALICWLLPLAVADGDPGRVLSEPGMAVGLLLALTCAIFLASFLTCAGSKRCPATVSATLATSAGMVVGYAAQVAYFHKPPGVPAVAGAAVMLLAVVVMTLARLYGDSAPPSVTPAASEGCRDDTSTRSRDGTSTRSDAPCVKSAWPVCIGAQTLPLAGDMQCVKKSLNSLTYFTILPV